MENWQESSKFIIWIMYILVAVILIGFFIIQLIRKNFIQEIERKREIAMLEEKHFQEMLDRHVKTQEIERERIGSDLHDAVSNRLNIILMKLRSTDKVQNIEEDLIETIQTVRRIAHDLNPPMIEKLPMQVLVFSQFDRLASNYHIVKWNSESVSEPWKVEYKIQLIRVVQELVNNIIKHANATEVDIKLRETKNRLCLIVKDNGVGIGSDMEGMGFQNIENRLFIINGKFKVKSAQNKGTKIIILLQR